MTRGVFLFSVDLEDPGDLLPGARDVSERLPENVERLLAFLDRHDVRTTFFTLGRVVRDHPGLVRRVAARGHELACHTSDHVPLDRKDPSRLRDDLSRNLEALAGAGAEGVVGFRAPMWSLTAGTAWAYDVLAELGFTYSSSVLPGRNPLYGWPGHDGRPRRTASGVWEIPATTLDVPFLGLPFASGIYLRLLPRPVVTAAFRRRGERGEPVVGVLHPYDIDTEQGWLYHPGLEGKPLRNALMYAGRRRVLDRLEGLLDAGLRTVTYRRFVTERLEGEADAAGG